MSPNERLEAPRDRVVTDLDELPDDTRRSGACQPQRRGDRVAPELHRPGGGVR